MKVTNIIQVSRNYASESLQEDRKQLHFTNNCTDHITYLSYNSLLGLSLQQ